MLAKVFAGNSFYRIHGSNAACGAGQQINDCTTSFLISGRRFAFHQCASEFQHFALPRNEMLAQRLQIFLGQDFCHFRFYAVIRPDRTVKCSTRPRLTSNPMPGLSSTRIVPFAVTVTGGSIMSSCLYTALAETSPGKVKPA